MPIPGDNGNPQEERDKQNIRIKEVADKGAIVRREMSFNPPAAKEETIFGKI